MALAENEREILQTMREACERGSQQDRYIRQLIVRTFVPYLDGVHHGLQLGYSEGIDTALLAKHVPQLDVVEANPAFVEVGNEQSPGNVAVIESPLELFRLPEGRAPYDAVFAVYVLEHLEDTASVLAMARRVLRPGGRVFVVVPNARSLSRQLAVQMGLLPNLKAVSQQDHHHGRLRVYDRIELNRDIESAGFQVTAQGGIMLKPLADFQLDRLYDSNVLGPAHVDGLYKLGLEHPDLCGSLYAVCTPLPPTQAPTVSDTRGL
jgi:SAM-dependent methyltransferase